MMVGLFLFLCAKEEQINNDDSGRKKRMFPLEPIVGETTKNSFGVGVGERSVGG